jgi:hypothetical protein
MIQRTLNNKIMSFIHTKTRLENDINSGIQNRSDMIININRLINNSASKVITDFTLRSAKRRTVLSPGITEGVDSAVAPRDLSGENIIDIVNQKNSASNRDWSLTNTEAMRSGAGGGNTPYQSDSLVAIDEFDGEKRILLSNHSTEGRSVSISTLDSVIENSSSWSALGSASNLRLSKYSYKSGSGALQVDIDNSSSTQFGIENDGLKAVDLNSTDFDDTASIFVYVYLPVNEGINGFDVRIGSSSSDYYSLSQTGQHDGTALITGWNLLRFDMPTASTTGVPDKSSISYASVTVDKDASVVDKKGFKFDEIVLHIHNPQTLYYYTKYPWVSTDGTYKPESTDTSDLLVADTDEYDLFLIKGLEMAYQEIEEDQRAFNMATKYQKMLQDYKSENPSNAMVKTTQYYKFDNHNI